MRRGDRVRTPHGPGTIVRLQRKNRVWSQAERRWLAPTWTATVDVDSGGRFIYGTGSLTPIEEGIDA
jgi:hypothetical protein